jgi:pimeloyl-ACP methyl ester carboxylesterase
VSTSREDLPASVPLRTRIAGAGPSLVLVHGVAADASTFRLLEQPLTRMFTVVTVDRRGRCGSPDGETYSLEAEFADLVAVVAELPSPVTVFGHSFGGNVALGAALAGANISRLVLYEAGRRGEVGAALHARLDRMLAEGDRYGAMRLTLLEFTRFPEEWIDDLLDTPPWQERLAYADTLARELRAYDEYDYGDLSQLAIPTLLLVGEESPPEEHAHAAELAARLPAATISVVPGQGHIAPVTAPQLLADLISRFAGR